ncbi:MAG TPA: four-carbon acid sugar kinase family protein, partial [Elusimicrobiota bacterium]|nr:four-carbon acid sugar kinase family protein [Elusimicrobiota bacterium]
CRWKADFIFKKIDSTLRGPVGAELAAFIEAVRPSAPVAFVPAFPRMGRTTVGGRHFVNGVPLHRTPFGIDPRHPIQTNVLTRILDASWPTGFQRQNAATRECVWVADVADERALAAVARRALDNGVAVGSAGLAAAVARQMGGRQKGPRPEAAVVGAGPVGVVVGSAHPLSGRQLARLKNFLPRSDVFLLERPESPGSPARVLRTLVSGARGLEKAHGIRRWVVTGGETAFALARLWKTPRWRVAGEIEPGVPLCVSVGPPPRVLVMKPGGFGSIDALLKATVRLSKKEK